MSFGLKKKKLRNKIIWWEGKEKSYQERAEGKTGAPRSKTSVFSPILSSAQNSLSSFHCSQQTQLKYISKGLPRPLPAASHTSLSSSSISLSFCFKTLFLLLTFMLIFAFCNLHEVLATLCLLCRRAVVANIVLPDRKALKQESTFRFSALSKCPLKSNLSNINQQDSSYMGNWETNQFPVQLHKHLSWHRGLSTGPRQSRQEERTQNCFFGMQQ